MTTDATARTELADFLRSRREQVAPASVGITTLGRRRTPGLRREEVSLLSGVSLTWYTWLEQGRDIHPSPQVIEALARTLHLTGAEGLYLRELAGHPSPAGTAVAELPDHGQRVLDAFGSAPAYVIARDWSIVGWNAAYARFYAGVADVAPSERNLLWLLWMDPTVRRLLDDWETDSRRFLATFRAEIGAHLHEPVVKALVDRLRAASEEFAEAWSDHDVDRFSSRARHFHHPDVGRLTLEHHQLTLSDCPDLHVIVYTAAPDTRTAEGLAELAGVGTS